MPSKGFCGPHVGPCESNEVLIRPMGCTCVRSNPEVGKEKKEKFLERSPGGWWVGGSAERGILHQR